MNILTKSMQAVKDFDASIVAARNEFEQTKKELFAVYSNIVAAEKLGAARDALTAFELNATKNARDIITADFAEARNMVLEFVTQPVPDSFTATLAAIQVKGDKITPFEAASFLEKYKDNYMAYSAVLKALNDFGHVTDVFTKAPDSLNDEIANMEKRILDWVNTRTSSGYGFGSEYWTRLLTKDGSSPIQVLDEKIEAYISGNFVLDSRSALVREVN